MVSGDLDAQKYLLYKKGKLKAMGPTNLNDIRKMIITCSSTDL
jgi:hypothetical protein